jgi:flagellar biosynthesis chaperone FliJ
VSLQSDVGSVESEMETLAEKIHLISKYQKPYVSNSLKKMAHESASNVRVICEYIILNIP